MLVGDGRADRLDLAPGAGRGGEGRARALEGRFGWLVAQRLDRLLERVRTRGDLGVTRPDVVLEGSLGDCRVVSLGMRRSS